MNSIDFKCNLHEIDRARIVHAMAHAIRDQNDDLLLTCVDLMSKLNFKRDDMNMNMNLIYEIKDKLIDLLLKRARDLEFSSCRDVYAFINNEMTQSMYIL